MRILANLKLLLSAPWVNFGRFDVARGKKGIIYRSEYLQNSVWSVELSLKTRQDPRLEELDEFVRVACPELVTFRSNGGGRDYLISGTDEMLFVYWALSRRHADCSYTAAQVLSKFSEARWRRVELNLLDSEVPEEFDRACKIASASVPAADWRHFFCGSLPRPQSRILRFFGLDQ